MRWEASQLKALFILFNYNFAVAAPPPGDYYYQPRHHITRDYDVVRHKTRGWSAVVRDVSDWVKPSLLLRQDPNDQGGTCRKCKKCKGNTARQKGDCTQCVPCPPGQKPNFSHKRCVPNDSDEDKEDPDDKATDVDKKGKCPDGRILDPAEGGQSKDTLDPVCIPDAKCPPGKVQGGLPRENAGETKPECVDDMKDEDKPKCNDKQYAFVQVLTNPVENTKAASYQCKPTREADGKCKKCNGTGKDEKYKKKKEAMAKNWRKGRFDRKKTTKKEEYQNRQRKINDDVSRKKSRRMGKCLTIYPLSLAQDQAMMYTDEFFSEDFMEQMELLGYWPADIPDSQAEPFLDDYIDTDQYIDQFLQIAQGISTSIEVVGRSLQGNSSTIEIEARNHDYEEVVETSLTLPRAASPPTSPTALETTGSSSRTDLIDVDVDKRNPIVALLILIFTAVITVATKVAAKAAARGGKFAKFTKDSIKVAKGAGKKSLPEQKAAVEKFTKDKNWKNCIRGVAPSK